MEATSREPWDKLLKAYLAADREWSVATSALERLPADAGFDAPEEKACDLAREKAYACEDALLEAAAPTLRDAAYQLKIITSRQHDVEVDEPAPAEEEGSLEGEALRRIHNLMIVADHKLKNYEVGEREVPTWRLLAYPIGGGLIGVLATAAVVYFASHS